MRFSGMSARAAHCGGHANQTWRRARTVRVHVVRGASLGDGRMLASMRAGSTYPLARSYLRGRRSPMGLAAALLACTTAITSAPLVDQRQGVIPYRG